MLEDFRLKVFMAVSEEGSFTRAARTLGISQPAVSQNIADLEKELGKELFVRARGQVVLTQAGTTFREYAARILHWCSVAEDLFGSAGKLRSPSPVTVAADCFPAETLLPGMLGSIIALNPGLSFKVLPPGSLETPDLLLTCRPHSAQMSFEDADTFLYSFDAEALSGIAGTGSSGTVHPATRMAVWTPYLPLLPLGMASKVVVDSYSTSMLRRLVSPELVVLVPKDRHFAGFPALDIDLSSLRMDMHAVPSPGFAGGAIYRSIRNLLSEKI